MKQLTNEEKFQQAVFERNHSQKTVQKLAKRLDDLQRIKLNKPVKGEKYRPIVKVEKVRKNKATVLLINGERFVWESKSQFKG